MATIWSDVSGQRQPLAARFCCSLIGAVPDVMATVTAQHTKREPAVGFLLYLLMVMLVCYYSKSPAQSGSLRRTLPTAGDCILYAEYVAQWNDATGTDIIGWDLACPIAVVPPP